MLSGAVILAATVRRGDVSRIDNAKRGTDCRARDRRVDRKLMLDAQPSRSDMYARTRFPDMSSDTLTDHGTNACSLPSHQAGGRTDMALSAITPTAGSELNDPAPATAPINQASGGTGSVRPATSEPCASRRRRRGRASAARSATRPGACCSSFPAGGASRGWNWSTGTGRGDGRPLATPARILKIRITNWSAS